MREARRRSCADGRQSIVSGFVVAIVLAGGGERDGGVDV